MSGSEASRKENQIRLYEALKSLTEQISRQIVRSRPASRTYVRQRVRTDKKGAPINKIATRPFRSELLSFLLHFVEALYYAKIH